MLDLTNEISENLWASSFGDSPEYIDFFLKNHPDSASVLSLAEKDEIVSQLFLLNGETVISGEKYASKYIFAACTAENYRRKGYMKKLMSVAAESAAAEGQSFLVLMPANEGLYGYYAELGFIKAFVRKKLVLSREVLTCLADVTSSYKMPDADCFCWGRGHIDYCFKENEFFGGVNFISADACMLARVIDACAEITYLEGDFSAIAAMLIENTKAELFCFTLPLDFPLSSDRFTVEDCGMLLPLTDEAARAATKIRNAYLGLTLE